MKRAFLLPAFVAAGLMAAVVPTVFAQEDSAPPPLVAHFKTLPLHGPSIKGFHAATVPAVVGTTQTLPMWTYRVTSPVDGNSYSGVMVGASPYFNGARTTNIPTMVIPLVITLPDGTVYDPTKVNPCFSNGSPLAQVQASPVFQPLPYALGGITMGTGQYIDEFQRANFYNTNVETTGDSYHNILSPVNTLPSQPMSIPANEGETWNLGSCGPLGIVDLTTFDSIITKTVLPSLAAQGVNPGTFPLFVINDVVLADPGTSIYENCCDLGYHSAWQASSGSPIQTYAVADYDTTNLFRTQPNIGPVSREVGGWMDNPLSTNTTPSWGNTGAIQGCYNNLEVGNAMADVLFSLNGVYGQTMSNGVTYYPQQLAFFSWFYRQNPSIAAASYYSNSGTFENSAGNICQSN
jgi:hypothetical protein